MTPATATRLPAPTMDRYRCSSCPYRISVVGRPPHRCPMCGGRSWQPGQHKRG